jgi:polyisoprenoid-binding protein YceI
MTRVDASAWSVSTPSDLRGAWWSRCLSGLLGLLLAVPAYPADVAERQILWRVDPQHSTVLFHLRALAVIGIEGRIDTAAGEVWRDAQGEWVQVRVPLAELSMSSERRRRWALSEEFFDAAKHPDLVFTAKVPAGAGFSTLRGDLAGTLLLRGVEASITVKLEQTQCASDAARCRVLAHGKVSRARFGMRSRSFALSDNVELDLQLQWQGVAPEDAAAP